MVSSFCLPRIRSPVLRSRCRPPHRGTNLPARGRRFRSPSRSGDRQEALNVGPVPVAKGAHPSRAPRDVSASLPVERTPQLRKGLAKLRDGPGAVLASAAQGLSRKTYAFPAMPPHHSARAGDERFVPPDRLSRSASAARMLSGVPPPIR
jgi:hypothetical protein